MTRKESDSGERFPPSIPIEQVVKDIINLTREQWGIIDPVILLKECIENEEWFKGIVLSTTFFEGIGIKLLSSYFKHQISDKRIEHLRLEQIIMFLYSSGIIDQPTYSKMIEVRDFRNKIVHFEELFTEIKLQPEKAKKIIEKAIDCLLPLSDKYLELVEETE